MPSPKLMLALATLPVVLLSACGNDDKKADKSPTSTPSSSSSSSAPAAATKGKIDDVSVDTKNPSKPTVTIPKDKLPFGTAAVATKVLTHGTGKQVGATDVVDADYTVVNGTTGKTLASSFGQSASPINMTQANTYLPGLIEVLKKSKVGDKVVASLPAAKGFGSAGNTDLGVGATDDLVIYMDVKSSDPYSLDCDTPSSDPSLPGVSVPSDSKKPATFTFTGKSAPKKLTCAVLKHGTGATVKKGQTISVTYTGQVWNGAVFDATAQHKEDGYKPTPFAIGAQQVISGWDRTLVGRKVGDRVLIVVPPNDGYGAQGNPPKIKGTDTIVFAVDIVGVK